MEKLGKEPTKGGDPGQIEKLMARSTKMKIYVNA
jgi:hypothetical protein